MKIYLVQHAEAKKEEEDPERGLTEKGIKDLKKIGNFIQKLNLKVSKIYHSGKKRAYQTAEILKEYLKLENSVEKIDGIAPMDEPELIFEKIKNFNEDIIIVGHLPNLSKISSLLISGDKSKEIISFKMGSILCLEKKEDFWVVNWFLKPDIL
jgi:phosphohistidine phosphatase